MTTILEVAGLTHNYGAIRAVDGISFAIHPGEIYGLLGPNGAGKTTTISILCGLLQPQSGTVTVDGRPMAADPLAAKRLMGVVPQDLALYEELSAAENLEFWGRLAGLDRRSARSRAAELLALLSLADRAKDPVKTFSGGMKRRVNIGCALLHRPKLLLFDEPTVGIDPQARQSIVEFIRGLRADGVAVLYTTHHLEEAQVLCDRIGIVDHGRMLAEGTLRELQDRLGGEQLFIVEGMLAGVRPDSWTEFRGRYRVIQCNDKQLVVGAPRERDPAECLRELLALPFRIENVTLKRPDLNDVFLQLTGRDLRE